MKKHISYSELKNWNDCAYKHKLIYIDEIKKFIGNEYTAFGQAIHDTCEQLLISGSTESESYFKHKFMHHLEDLKCKGVDFKDDLVKSMWERGPKLPSQLMPALNNYLGEFEVVETECLLYERMSSEEDEDFYFKGYIDAVLKTKDGKYHIFDWKTCSWGWDARKKNDRMITYQLTLYKHYFSVKNKIDPDNIETHFGLIKRTAKTKQVEIFKVPNGKRKIENALKLLNVAVYNIQNKRHIKNRLSCTSGYGCEFYNTKFCR